MPRFLNTEGNAVIAIFICDRCRMKRAIIEAMPDPNFPGLKVCQQGCADEKDPYRLPARKTERIALQFPRPDVSVATDPNEIVTQPYGGDVLSTEQSNQTPSQDGNNAVIGLQP
ncbi:hypothetical protein UFOVP239_66 [uncultured Caudovirales phage]|uniref:Uncharacterized protein n=1 Tax=uncultured Caudovirales phage TaxID=2100421 RepID=A0A6J7WTL1_9CAUD|nr:hypothetical protein UFOVP239_66 [uncultured Caudovirales phage]